MENRIPGDIIRVVDPSRACLEGADLIKWNTPDTFGAPLTVLTGRTLRGERWETGEKFSFSTTPTDENARGKTQLLGNRTLLKPQGPQAPNLGNHSK